MKKKVLNVFLAMTCWIGQAYSECVWCDYAFVDMLRNRDKKIVVQDTIVYSTKKKTLFSLGKNQIIDFSVTYEKDTLKTSSHFLDHWIGFYSGYIQIGQTNYSDYEGDEFLDLDRANSFVWQFNMMSFVLLSNSKLGLISGLGLEYQRMCFNRDITLEKDKNGDLQPLPLSEKGIENVKRSVFKILYLTLPLLVEYQFSSKRPFFYLSGGLVGGVRLHSKTKIVFKNEYGNKQKWKNSGSYNLLPLKADAMVSFGFGRTCIWGSYTLTPIFNTKHAPKVHPYMIGLGLTF